MRTNPSHSIIVTFVLVVSLVFAVYQNLNYITPLSQILSFLQVRYTPIDLFGLPQAAVATLQILILGTIVTRSIQPAQDDRSNGSLLLKISSVGFGIAIVGTIATILSSLRLLFFSD